MSKKVLVLDGDVIAYKCAAANETRSIRSIHKEKQVAERWENRTAFKKFLETTDHTIEMYDIEDVQDARHISYCHTLVRNMIQGICTRAKISEYEIILSGKENFRDLIPLPYKYKSNRDDSLRPLQLKAIRKFMIEELGAKVVKGEADDFLAMRKSETVRKTTDTIYIAATVDKDDDGVQGWSFNWDKMKEPEQIKGFGALYRDGTKVRGKGRIFMYYQSVFGDKVDGYRPADIATIAAEAAGKPKVQFGEVAAYNLLKDAKDDKEALTAILGQYRKWYGDDITTYTDWEGIERKKDAIDIWQMYIDCAHMQRFEGDRIDLRALLTKLGVI